MRTPGAPQVLTVDDDPESHYLLVVAINTRSELPLRERKRLGAMKRVQREAVARFDRDGFDGVTVEQIAAAADVSPMSVYRWFGTKEALIIWDEFDPPILDAVTESLAQGHRPLTAVRSALTSLLDEVYDRERELALARTQLIFREPALQAAAADNARGLRAALSQLFAVHGGLPTTKARVAATVVTALLESAIEAWQHEDGRRSLAQLIGETFDTLEGLT
jgi:AcrR family transcriptional regulator